ncbi:MAG TPA: hypothetical protein VGI78_15855 [Acetobacteraceae bacterium]
MSVPRLCARWLTLPLLPFAATAQPVRVGVAVSSTGFGEAAGVPGLDAAKLAVDEANADGANIQLMQ